jgi:hypothetical protein
MKIIYGVVKIIFSYSTTTFFVYTEETTIAEDVIMYLENNVSNWIRYNYRSCIEGAGFMPYSDIHYTSTRILFNQY